MVHLVPMQSALLALALLSAVGATSSAPAEHGLQRRTVLGNKRDRSTLQDDSGIKPPPDVSEPRVQALERADRGKWIRRGHLRAAVENYKTGTVDNNPLAAFPPDRQPFALQRMQSNDEHMRKILDFAEGGQAEHFHPNYAANKIRVNNGVLQSMRPENQGALDLHLTRIQELNQRWESAKARSSGLQNPELRGQAKKIKSQIAKHVRWFQRPPTSHIEGDSHQKLTYLEGMHDKLDNIFAQEGR